MDAVDRERYTTQMQLIEQDVSANTDAGCRVLYLLSLHRLVLWPLLNYIDTSKLLTFFVHLLMSECLKRDLSIEQQGSFPEGCVLSTCEPCVFRRPPLDVCTMRVGEGYTYLPDTYPPQCIPIHLWVYLHLPDLLPQIPTLICKQTNICENIILASTTVATGYYGVNRLRQTGKNSSERLNK